MNTHKLWRSGQVQRWHTNPEMVQTGQTNGSHQWGCLALLLHLHPNPSRELIIDIATHDVGEIDAGDIGGPFKRANPDFTKNHEVIERKSRDETLGHRYNDLDCYLTEEDRMWRKMIDRLEAFLYVSLHRPDLITKRGWPECERFIRGQSVLLECDYSVHDLIEAAKGY